MVDLLDTLRGDFLYDPHRVLPGFDPFLGTPTQTNRLRAYCTIIVDGFNITNKLDPHLISVRVVDEGIGSAEIEIDDREGRLPIPLLGKSVQIQLGWTTESMKVVFTGTTNDVENKAAAGCGFTLMP